LDIGPIGLSLSKLWKAEKIRSDGRQNLNGIDDKALTKIREDENFFRKRRCRCNLKTRRLRVNLQHPLMRRRDFHALDAQSSGQFQASALQTVFRGCPKTVPVFVNDLRFRTCAGGYDWHRSTPYLHL